MNNSRYKIHAPVWLYPGMAGWHFITIPKKESDEIKKKFGIKKPGWGSLRVMVTMGKTTWKTSIFPDKKAGVYLLPLKSDVRKKEGISEGNVADVILTITL